MSSLLGFVPNGFGCSSCAHHEAHINELYRQNEILKESLKELLPVQAKFEELVAERTLRDRAHGELQRELAQAKASIGELSPRMNEAGHYRNLFERCRAEKQQLEQDLEAVREEAKKYSQVFSVQKEVMQKQQMDATTLHRELEDCHTTIAQMRQTHTDQIARMATALQACESEINELRMQLQIAAGWEQESISRSDYDDAVHTMQLRESELLEKLHSVEADLAAEKGRHQRASEALQVAQAEAQQLSERLLEATKPPTAAELMPQLAEARSTLQTVNQRCEALEAEAKATADKHAQIERDWTAQMLTQSSRNEELLQQAESLQTKLREAASRMAAQQEELQRRQEQAEVMIRQERELSGQNAQLTTQLTASENRRRELTEALSDAKTRLAEAEARYSRVESSSADFQAMQSRLREATAKSTSLQDEVQRRQDQADALLRQERELVGKNAQLAAQLAASESHRRELAEALGATKAQLAESEAARRRSTLADARGPTQPLQIEAVPQAPSKSAEHERRSFPPPLRPGATVGPRPLRMPPGSNASPATGNAASANSFAPAGPAQHEAPVTSHAYSDATTLGGNSGPPTAYQPFIGVPATHTQRGVPFGAAAVPPVAPVHAYFVPQSSLPPSPGRAGSSAPSTPMAHSSLGLQRVPTTTTTVRIYMTRIHHQDAAPSAGFRFAECGSGLAVSNLGLTVAEADGSPLSRHRWATAVCSPKVSYGVHQWSVRLTRGTCIRVGVVAADAAVALQDSMGNDNASWAINLRAGDSHISLLHNEGREFHSASLPQPFGPGSVVQLKLDLAADSPHCGTLMFAVDGTSCGVAFRGLTGHAPLCPAISLGLGLGSIADLVNEL